MERRRTGHREGDPECSALHRTTISTTKAEGPSQERRHTECKSQRGEVDVEECCSRTWQSYLNHDLTAQWLPTQDRHMNKTAKRFPSSSQHRLVDDLQDPLHTEELLLVGSCRGKKNHCLWRKVINTGRFPIPHIHAHGT